MRRGLVEALVYVASLCGSKLPERAVNVGGIFVLRNNDIGDLLVATPLFEALRRGFPSAAIVAGIGRWNKAVLENNPHVSEILEVNAPWHNQTATRCAHNSARGFLNSLAYIYFSDESKQVQARHFDIGIDVLGSPEGSLLLMRCGIPHRLGVKGYAGGHSGVQQAVNFNPAEHVGRSALRFAELLGAQDLPEVRPQLFLTPQEGDQAELTWRTLSGDSRALRIVIGPGGGFAAKCWPLENYCRLAAKLAALGGVRLAIVGGPADARAADAISTAASGVATSFAGKHSLRQTFGLVSLADLVISNSSMLMHVAAAFGVRSFVLLGASFKSAREHASQWGHPSSLVLGREVEHPQIFGADEVYSRITGEIGSITRR